MYIVKLEMSYIIVIDTTDDDDYAKRQHIENNEITAKSRCAYCKRRVTLKDRVAAHIVNIKTKEMFLVDMHDECKTTEHYGIAMQDYVNRILPAVFS